MFKHCNVSSCVVLFFLFSMLCNTSKIFGQPYNLAHSNRSLCPSESIFSFSSQLFLFYSKYCLGDKYNKWTLQAQRFLHVQNHPYDCMSVSILLCSTEVNKFQGTGSRLFFLGRCLTEGLNSKRVVVLSNELPSTLDMLSPFEAWSNCSINDILSKKKGTRIKYYYPMDSKSLTKSVDMPAVGALYPSIFADRGYWWWKAQEITYALRPRNRTREFLKYKFGKTSKDRVVFQVRRTDKTQGCASFYGSKSAIKCKAEAKAPKLVDYMNALEKYKRKVPKPIQVVTDDVNIMHEISETEENGYFFLDPEPAPRRIPDKHGKGGIYKNRAMKDALDILSMSYGNPLVFTYSSGFGALALQIKQVREYFCSNWVSLDWGKREWPPVGTLSEGGIRGVTKNSNVVSKICGVAEWATYATHGEKSYCSVILKSSKSSGAAVFTFCNCK